jgi:glycerol-3-phosphate O-acyltransferase
MLLLLFLQVILLLLVVVSTSALLVSKNNVNYMNKNKKSLLILKSTTQDKIIEQEYNQITSAINNQITQSAIPDQFKTILIGFISDYSSSLLSANKSSNEFKSNIQLFLTLINQAMTNPYQFQPFHKALRGPKIDYYNFGNDFLKPLIIDEESKVFGIEKCKLIESYIANGDNVIILSNHQTECDPQVISILLEKSGYSSLAEKIIFIAGHKVTSDPVAIPFSMGRNLICIHSKKHIKNPPEDLPRKQAQNMESMKAMNELVTEGGKIFWVAPSGGRDRPDSNGDFVVAPFDYKSLDMFKLLGIQSKKPLHFFPMAMYTNKLVPPPDTVSSTLGEQRSAKRGAVSFHILDETDGMGGLKDKEFCNDLQLKVENAFNDLVKFHQEVSKK